MAATGAGAKRSRRPTVARQEASPDGKWPGWLPWVSLLILTILAYLPALKAGYIWDDDDYVTQNLALRSWDGLRGIWLKPGTTPQYYPLVHTTFWLEYQAWGLRAAGYHAVNIMLHATNACLAWVLLRRLQVPCAWAAAALFALHPVHVESVAWITERKNVLSGFFYLLSALCCVRVWCLDDGYAKRDTGSRKWYFLALALFLAALLSKTVTCTLPAAVLLLVWWKRGSIGSRDWLFAAPFILIGAALSAVTIWMEKAHVGASGYDWELSFAQRVLIAGRAVWFYATKLLLPFNLTFIYPKWTVDTGQPWQWAFPVAFFGLVALLFFMRGRIGRGSLCAVLFFAGSLFPALGFFDTFPMRYSYVADHFQYLASLGLLALAGPLTAWALRRMGRDTVAWIGGAILAAFAFLTWQQCGIYKDLETLWRDTLAKNPNAGIAHVNLANLLTEREQYDAAQQHYTAALAINPRDDYAHYNAGVNYYRQGNVDAAVLHYLEATKIRPDYIEAHYNLGKALEQEREFEDAAESYQAAIRLNPNVVEPRISLASMYTNLGNLPGAAVHYEKALELAPTHPVALFNYANVLIGLGRRPDAVRTLEFLLRMFPHDTEARELLKQVQQAN